MDLRRFLSTLVLLGLLLPAQTVRATNPCGDGDSGSTWQQAYWIVRDVACPSNSVNDTDPDRDDWYATQGCAFQFACADDITVKVCAQAAPGGLGGVLVDLDYKATVFASPVARSANNLVLSGACTTLTGNTGLQGDWYIHVRLAGIGRIRYSLCLDSQAATSCSVA
jgi:hypothetical protein